MGKAAAASYLLAALVIAPSWCWASHCSLASHSQGSKFTNLRVQPNSDGTYDLIWADWDPSEKITGPEGNEVIRGSLLRKTESEIFRLLGKPTTMERKFGVTFLTYAQVNRSNSTGLNSAASLVLTLEHGRVEYLDREEELISGGLGSEGYTIHFVTRSSRSGKRMDHHHHQ